MTDIALDEKAMGAAIAEPDDTQWHIDRMDSIVRDLWAANDIDLHMCNDTVKRNQSGLLHDIRNSWRIVRRALATASPSQAAPANPAQGVPGNWSSVLRSRADATYLRDTEGTVKLLRETADYFDALTAAIGVGGQAVEVKPLVWSEDRDDDGTEIHRTRGGEVNLPYAVYEDGFIKKPFGLSLNQLRIGSFDTVVEAKAAAQKDYERRILSALSQPHPADERVAPTKGVSNKAEEGRQAYKDGQSKDCNPYPQGTARYWQWSSGWFDERAFRPHPQPLPLKDEVERPDFWAVQSKTGMHIGLWTDRADADEAMHEYEGGTIMPLFKSSPLSRLRAGEQEGWRDIAGAPKDGTHVLVCFGPYDQWTTFAQKPPTVAHWFGPPPLPGLRAGGWYPSVQTHDGNQKLHPTHWMPLPAAPSEQGGDRG